jgi:protocatechuate 4,5-dioxygenase alpha chain
MVLPMSDGLDDIPGTTVFTGEMSRKGFHLNQFCMSLLNAENRARFKADERAYVEEWPMTEAQKQAVLARDWNAAIAEGGNIYFLAKIIFMDGTTFPEVASAMTGIPLDEFTKIMLTGGRSPEGLRSVREGR